MNRCTWIYGVAFAMLSTAAFAQSPRCTNDGTSFDSLRCEEEKLKEPEQSLNSAYTQLLANLEGSKAREGLIKAQREWIKFRDLDCDAKYELRPGASLQSWYRMNCRLEHATQRAAQLRTWNSD
jgi:uncharacterized protein YecT (DUF1311 family)